jgi:hypothetical protein
VVAYLDLSRAIGLFCALLANESHGDPPVRMRGAFPFLFRVASVPAPFITAAPNGSLPRGGALLTAVYRWHALIYAAKLRPRFYSGCPIHLLTGAECGPDSTKVFVVPAR